MGGRRNGRGVRWYSGRGGRVEESSIAVIAIRSVVEWTIAALRIRKAAVVGPLRPGSTKV